MRDAEELESAGDAGSGDLAAPANI